MKQLPLTLHQDLVGSTVLPNGKLALYKIPKGAQMTMSLVANHTESTIYGDTSTFYMTVPGTVSYTVTVDIPHVPTFQMIIEETRESYLKKLLGEQENKK